MKKLLHHQNYTLIENDKDILKHLMGGFHSIEINKALKSSNSKIREVTSNEKEKNNRS